MTDRAQATVLTEEKIADPGPEELAVELFSSPNRFINRELSWLHFNRRVLEESEQRRPSAARAGALPRRSRPTISTNSSWSASPASRDRCAPASPTSSPDGLTPAEQLGRIAEAVSALASDQQKRWRELRQALAEEGVVLVEGPDVTKKEKAWLEDHFLQPHLPAAHAARHRSGASVPVHLQSRLHHRAAARARERRQGR